MLKKTLSVLILILLTTLVNGFSQGYYPSVVVLSPKNTIIEPSYNYEIEAGTRKAQKAARERMRMEKEFRYEMKSEAENIQLMTRKDNTMGKHINFVNNISYNLSQYLQYRFLQKFNNVLVYAVPNTAEGTAEGLSKVANQENVQFVINIPEVETISQGDLHYVRLKIQLFEKTTNRILLEKDYTGKGGNPGGDFTCDEGSLDCMINNAIIPAIGDIFKVMFKQPSGSATPKKK